MPKKDNCNDYYNFIVSGLNLKWHQKLLIKLILTLPKGRKESKRFDQFVRAFEKAQEYYYNEDENSGVFVADANSFKNVDFKLARDENNNG